MHSLSGDNNLVPFHLWRRKIVLKSEKGSKCFAQDFISSDFKDGVFKNVDINKKKSSLQCSWIKRICDDSFHEWNLISLKLKSFGDNLKFLSNLS